MIEMRTAYTMVQTTKGLTDSFVFRFKCERCHHSIMFFNGTGCPVTCIKCDAVLPDLRRMYDSLRERIDWHQYYMISYKGNM